ncbi:MAG: hypothetical protein AB7S44_02060 [Spirochaetales bacterium]
MIDEYNLKSKSSGDVKCASCGGSMEFNPELQVLKCVQCGSVIDFASDEPVIKKDFDNVEKEFQSWDNESVLIKCENCGAKEVVNSKNIAHKCSFCGSSKIIPATELPGLKPNGVLPFSVTEKKATSNFMAWLKKKWFTPNDLKTKARINVFSGVYTPTWSYDSNVHTDYKGVLERTETRTGHDGKMETYTVSIPVKGSRDDDFVDVLVPVGQKIDRVSFERLQPFNFKTLRIYDKNYLAGFAANHYSINSTEAWKTAIMYMKSAITTRILRRHNAERVRYLDMDMVHKNNKYSYLLLPIWVCNYYYKEKLYNFFINGNTGKVTGKVPRSAIKIILFVLFILAAIIGLNFLVPLLGGNMLP